MAAFIVRRIGEGLATILVVALIAFALFRYVGDPIMSIAGPDATQRDRDELREQLGLNDAVPVQFIRFVAHAAQGDFGFSYRSARPVSALLAERLPATIELVAVGATLSLLLGTGLGIVVALKRKSALARSILTVSLFGVCLPTFVNGIVLIYLFSVTLHWLPSFGRGEVVHVGSWSTGLATWSGLRSLIMPGITLALFQLAMLIRLVSSEMTDVMQTDFIRFCRARGLRRGSILFRHGLRNAMMPVVTVVGLNIGSVIAFSAITETVFQWPGMSLLFIDSVRFGDIPVMAAYLVLVATVFVLINLTVDILYFFIDPRLRLAPSAAAAQGSAHG
jgi:peptide/nickel transport system permease protein